MAAPSTPGDRGWSAEDLATLRTLLAPDGEGGRDATEAQRRTRAPLAALEARPFSPVAGAAVVDAAGAVEAELAGLPPEAWPAAVVTLVFADRVVQLGTPGRDTFTAALTLDPGGDDTYRARPAPVQVHVDLAGDDLWTGGDGTLGGTLGGVSVRVDRAGHLPGDRGGPARQRGPRRGGARGGHPGRPGR